MSRRQGPRFKLFSLVLRSALGRRIFGLFVLAALVPVSVIGLTLYTHFYDKHPDILHVYYRAFLIAVGASLFVVLLLSRIQIRQIMLPLQRLLAGTRRIEKQDFTTQIDIAGRDEFGLLAGAFNSMAMRLGLHFGILKALSHIDRTILTSLNIPAVVRTALTCVRKVSSAQFVSIGLLEPEAAGAIRVYSLRKDGLPTLPQQDLPWSEQEQRMLDSTPAAQWIDSLPLPDGFLPQLSTEQNALKYWVQPITRAGKCWGVVVIATATRNAQPLAEDRMSLLMSVTDRLAVALATAARDRQLHLQAHYDALTGLPNRLYLHDLLNQELAHARRDEHRLSVLFLDLDRFKQTNDTLGHAVGDALLKQAAGRIRQAVRESDTVARLGGDEFTIVLGKVSSPRDAGNVAKQLIRSLSQAFEIEGHTLYVGASVGIAIFPDDALNGPDLLKCADTAMYDAKELGRGRFAYFEERMNDEVKERATLDRELRQALERNEFVLHYQPQVDLRTGRICCAEALLRWKHPKRGMLAPGSFIETAEESGLIDKIGRWVLMEASSQQARWTEQGVPIPRVSVNVSNRQLGSVDFIRAVDYILLTSGIKPDVLEIEITESLFLEGGQTAVDALRALEAAGVRVAIDDFGTGYSSLSYLRTLPASILKLDKSFIDDIATDPDAATIAAAIINMAQTLRKEVIAEGVETTDQVTFLHSHGCERMQGYLLSKPLPPHEFADFVMSFNTQTILGGPAPQQRPLELDLQPATVQSLPLPFDLPEPPNSFPAAEPSRPFDLAFATEHAAEGAGLPHPAQGAEPSLPAGPVEPASLDRAA